MKYLIMIVCLFWSSAFAATVQNGLVGDETLVHEETEGDQTDVDIAFSANGQFVIVWVERESFDVYAQQYDQHGDVLGAAFQVNENSFDESPEDGMSVAVAMNLDGDFVVVWSARSEEDDGNQETTEFGDGDGDLVMGRLFDADGSAKTDELIINESGFEDQNDPDVAMDDDGDIVVVWASYPNGSYDIYARLLDETGDFTTSEFLVNQTGENDQVAPVVGMSADGDFVVVWETLAISPSTRDIFLRVYNSDGTEASDEKQVNTPVENEGSNETNPDVAVDVYGNFVVVWETNVTGDLDIKGKVFDPKGTATINDFEVNVEKDSEQSAPRVAVSYDGGSQIDGDDESQEYGDFVVTWMSFGENGGNANGDDILLRRFKSDGIALDDPIYVNTTFAKDQAAPAVAADIDGDVIVAWESTGDDENDIYFQRISGMDSVDVSLVEDSVSNSGDLETYDFEVENVTNADDETLSANYPELFDTLGQATGITVSAQLTESYSVDDFESNRDWNCSLDDDYLLSCDYLRALQAGERDLLTLTLDNGGSSASISFSLDSHEYDAEQNNNGADSSNESPVPRNPSEDEDTVLSGFWLSLLLLPLFAYRWRQFAHVRV